MLGVYPGLSERQMGRMTYGFVPFPGTISLQHLVRYCKNGAGSRDLSGMARGGADTKQGRQGLWGPLLLLLGLTASLLALGGLVSYAIASAGFHRVIAQPAAILVFIGGAVGVCVWVARYVRFHSLGVLALVDSYRPGMGLVLLGHVALAASLAMPVSALSRPIQISGLLSIFIGIVGLYRFDKKLTTAS